MHKSAISIGDFCNHWRTGGGGLGAPCPPNKVKPCFFQFHTYSTCCQIKISFLGVPQIAHFQVEKMQKLPTVGGGTPPPTPYPRSIATLSRAWSLRSLAKIAPPNVFAHYATVRNVFKFHAYSVNIRLFLTTAKLVRRSNS